MFVTKNDKLCHCPFTNICQIVQTFNLLRVASVLTSMKPPQFPVRTLERLDFSLFNVFQSY